MSKEVSDQTRVTVLSHLEDLRTENLRLTRELRKLQLLGAPQIQQSLPNENKEAILLAEVQTAALERDRTIEELRARIDFLTLENRKLSTGGSLYVERSNSSTRFTEKKVAELELMVRERQIVIDKSQDANALLKAELIAARQDIKTLTSQVKTQGLYSAGLEQSSAELAEKLNISEDTAEQLSQLILKSKILGSLNLPDSGARICGVGKSGLFVLAESLRDLETVYDPKDYQMRPRSNGFSLTSASAPALDFSLADVDPLRLSFWLASLREVKFENIEN